MRRPQGGEEVEGEGEREVESGNMHREEREERKEKRGAEGDNREEEEGKEVDRQR